MASMLRSRRSEKTMMPIASGDFKLWKFFCSPSKGNRLSEVSSGKLIFSLFQLACNKVSGILDTKTSSNLERGESGFLFGEGRGCFER